MKRDEYWLGKDRIVDVLYKEHGKGILKTKSSITIGWAMELALTAVQLAREEEQKSQAVEITKLATGAIMAHSTLGIINRVLEAKDEKDIDSILKERDNNIRRETANQTIKDLLNYLAKESYEEAESINETMIKEKNKETKRFWDFKYHAQIVNAHHFEAMNTQVNRKYYIKRFLSEGKK